MNCARLGLSCSFLILACGASSPPVEAPASPTATAAPENVAKPAPTLVIAAPTALAPNLSASLPPALEKAIKLACTLQTSAWAQGTIKLRFAAGATPFASIGRPKLVKVYLGQDANLPTTIEVDAGTATVLGRMDAKDIELFPTQASALQEQVVLLPGASVRGVGAGPDSVRFEVPVEGTKVKLSKATDERPCSFFSLEKKTFDPLTATGSDSTRQVAFRPGKHDIGASESNSRSAVSIETDDQSPYAVLLATQGSRSRVAWQANDILVFGWIDSSRATPKPTAVHSGDWIKRVPPQEPKERSTAIDGWKKVTCEQAVPLIAEMGSERFQVGTIKAGSAVQAGPDRNGLTRVALPGSDLLPGDTSNFFAPSVQFAGTCRAQ
jgi:hypothetical protein